MSLKIRDYDLQVKADSDGRFSGYGSIFGNVDFDKDVVAPGAFRQSLSERKRPFPILWQHRDSEPLGVYERVEEDSKGLYVEGRLLIADVARAREAHALMRAGAVTGLSIGYWPRESTTDEKTGVRTLLRVDLDEVSIVTRPANDEARIDAIKTKLAHGGLPTIRELEAVLRDAGLPRSKAATIAAYGLNHLLRDAEAPANEPALGELVSRLRGFSLPKI